MNFSSSPLHVVPNHRGHSRVQREGAQLPLSQHGSATDAELAARRETQSTATPEIVLHDRYGRTRRFQREVT